MTVWQRIIIIALCVLGTMLTRFLPFILFQKNTPKTVQYLGKALPPASFALLLVYCLRNVQLFSGNHGLPEFLSLGLTHPDALLEAEYADFHLLRHRPIYAVSTGNFGFAVLTA